MAQLAQEVYNNDALQLMVQSIWRFEFEVRLLDLLNDLNTLLKSSSTLGEEGCISNIQQLTTTSNWDKVAHCWISHKQTRSSFYCLERVSYKSSDKLGRTTNKYLHQVWESRCGAKYRHDLAGDVTTWSIGKDATLLGSLLYLSRSHRKNDVWCVLWCFCQFQRDTYSA